MILLLFIVCSTALCWKILTFERQVFPDTQQNGRADSGQREQENQILIVGATLYVQPGRAESQ